MVEVYVANKRPLWHQEPRIDMLITLLSLPFPDGLMVVLLKLVADRSLACCVRLLSADETDQRDRVLCCGLTNEGEGPKPFLSLGLVTGLGQGSLHWLNGGMAIFEFYWFKLSH